MKIVLIAALLLNSFPVFADVCTTMDWGQAVSTNTEKLGASCEYSADTLRLLGAVAANASDFAALQKEGNIISASVKIVPSKDPKKFFNGIQYTIIAKRPGAVFMGGPAGPSYQLVLTSYEVIGVMDGSFSVWDSSGVKEISN